jgi:NHLM bacteriocin system ABC transporter peptidase/ATP-binding protein
MDLAAFLARSPRRTPVVLQLEAAECAAASLAIVLGYHGLYLPLDELRTLCGVSRDGAKASSILRAGRVLGMTGKGLKAEPHHLRDLDGPLIAFVNFNHFLVVEAVDDRQVWINDPATGRGRMTWDEFSLAFTGVVLSLAPGPDFVPGDRRPVLFESLKARFRGLEGALVYLVLLSLALAVPGIILPVFSRIFVDYVLVRGLTGWLGGLLAGMAITGLVRLVLALFQVRALLSVRLAMTLRTGSQLMGHLMSLPIAFFDQRFAGEIADRVRLNQGLSDLLTGKLAAAAVSLVSAFFFLIVMFLFQSAIALGILLIALVNVAVLVLSNRVISERYRKLSLDQGKLMGARVAGLKDIGTFKASGAEDMLFARWMGLATGTINGRQSIGALVAWLSPLPTLLSALGTAFVLIVGGRAVMTGSLTLGELVALQSLAASFSAPVAALAGFGAELQQIRSYTGRLDDILAQRPDPRLAAPPDAPAGKVPGGHLELRGVCFGYAPLDPPLIENFDLELAPGRRVALVGGSGSGKSTVGKIIAGLETPRSGECLVDGVPLANWPRGLLASRLAYVPQQIMLFEASFADNLSLWDASLPSQAMIAAAQDAQIHGLIATRPGNYGAPVAEGGRNLSGGERQRIEIARALATDPAILVLDEATSALDPLTELRVLEAVRRRGISCVVIAHRLSAIRDCDEIIVLQAGKVVERGTHAGLMAASGAYRTLLEF